MGSVNVTQGFCCSTTCGIFPDQGSNPCPLHWQADSYPLYSQGSPPYSIVYICICVYIFIHKHRVCMYMYTYYPPYFLYLFICWQCLDCFHIMATPHLITPTPARFFLPLNVRTARQGDNLPGLIWGKDRDLSLRLPVGSQNPNTSHFTSERPL